VNELANQQSPGGQLRELALFAGAGGGILGSLLLGWRTVCAVEINAYAASVLVQRQNDGVLPPFPVWDDICTFDGKPWRGIVDVVSGGFPCQDISCAGKGAGITGERSGLWKEMARIIGDVRPKFAFIENSPALIVQGLETVLCDLAQMGYDAKWGIVSAENTGAIHKRKRIFILANADGERRQLTPEQSGNNGEMLRQGLPTAPKLQICGKLWDESIIGTLGLPHGFTSCLDAIKAAGNAQVPAVVHLAWNTLCDMKGR
jgi:DNA (cytosine-5)-methyltransferase 1